MKLTATTLALLGFLSTYGSLAHAGNQNQDYNACKATVAETFPDYKKIRIKRMRSSSMNLWVKFEDAESIEVKCSRADHTLALTDGTSLTVASK